MWPFKSKPQPARTITLHHRTVLRVHLRDGSTLAWQSDLKLDQEPSAHWREFIVWFHGRPQSLSYTIFHRDGQAGLLRSEIKGYDIRKELQHG
jgi:hypothetical protein